mgnify:CR=1 FL=1|jgi:large subunit ribosomal protein L17
MAMLRNQATALLQHERIRTTVPRAKELRPFVERLITIAKRGLAGGDAARGVHARRLVRRDIVDQKIVSKLFEAVAPRFEERPGGYTRLLRLGSRRGDNAQLAQVELVGSEYVPDSDTPEIGTDAPEKAAKKTGVGGRLRAAARRIRGKDETVPGAGQPAKATKRAAGAKRGRSSKKGGS